MIPHLSIPARFWIYLRFVRYLLWEFRWPLLVFAALVVGGGAVLWEFYEKEELTFARACHAVFLLIFLESSLEFPKEWYLQPLFFLFPIIGLGAIADSVIRLAFLMFSRKQNQPEWNRMLASLCRNHVVVAGAGRVGFQIVQELLELREQVVVIEKDDQAPLLFDLFKDGIPVISGNARNTATLEEAGVKKAKAVIAATSDDLSNLDIGLTAREVNATARIVLRLFDETLASKVTGAFAMPTISTSQVAAPAFIAAATGRKVYQGFHLAGQYVHLTDMVVSPSGSLAGKTVGEIQADKRLNIVMHQGPEGVNVNPDASIVLSPSDTILVIAPIEPLLELESLNRTENAERPGALSRAVLRKGLVER